MSVIYADAYEMISSMIASDYKHKVALQAVKYMLSGDVVLIKNFSDHDSYPESMKVAEFVNAILESDK